MNDKPAEAMLGGAAGIDCEIAEVLISRKVDGELNAADNGRLQEHLRICIKCSCRLESWIHQSRRISGELDGLWPRGSRGGDAVLPPLQLPRNAIFPLSIAASQVVACAGLIVYCLFFNLTNRTPEPPSQTVLIPAQAQAADKTPHSEIPLPAAMNFDRSHTPDQEDHEPGCDGPEPKLN